ncbi:hypothetical protein MWH25_07735 [Natroniella acetigena]|uniref:hypothetical protein n=1 Tax=Natroniella acetigena TaxID=52004 RepID=UPI00200AC59E|nr:hypothetical protein [Natroniella acetigena]MCK8827632.1 hypothetical protein [Natroniella acetigena]
MVFEEIVLDFRNNIWFEANLVSVLGAIYNQIVKTNYIEVRNLQRKVEDIFRINGFLCALFDQDRAYDKYNTTIKYKEFNSDEARSFAEYLRNELLINNELPKMSERLKKEIRGNIEEIFQNARIHGNCDKVFSCGQYYYKNAKIDFTITDIGDTIKDKYEERFKQKISGEDAIKWAVEPNNTTKVGTPGGLGINLLRDFLRINKGKVHDIQVRVFK